MSEGCDCKASAQDLPAGHRNRLGCLRASPQTPAIRAAAA